MSRVSKLVAAFCYAALCVAGTAGAQEWTRFRGPNGTGVGQAENLPVRWSEEGFLWRTPLAGSGNASPVLWGDRVFVFSADGEKATRVVQCLRAGDGEVLWTRRYESRPYKQHPNNSYATATPAVDQRHVYLCWTTPESHTLRALTHAGKEAWKIELGPFKSWHGSGASPVVVDGMVVVAGDQRGESFVAAFDAETGKRKWRIERPSGNAAYGTPCVYRPKGEDRRARLIFASTAAGLAAVDAQTGRVCWKMPKAFPRRVVSSPVTADGLIFATCGEGSGANHLVAVRPPAGEADKPSVAYRITRHAPYVPTVLAASGLLFAWSDAGVVTCLDAESGQTVWQEHVKGKFHSSPVLVDGRIYCPSVKGEMVVLAASRRFKLLARNPLGEGTRATPAIAGARMYVRTQKHLLALGAEHESSP